jgi:hypothetical protein
VTLVFADVTRRQKRYMRAPGFAAKTIFEPTAVEAIVVLAAVSDESVT